jgi:hypothetical protein
MEMDALLLPYLQAADEVEAQQIMTRLMDEQAEPIITGIVARKLGFSSAWRQEDAADVRGDIRLRLLHRLVLLRHNPSTTPILNFRAYVIVVSTNGCAAYLRQQYPQRHRLTHRLQYLLTSQSQFGLWQREHEEWFGGFAGWGNELLTRPHLSAEQVRQLLDEGLPPQLHGIPDATCRRVSAAEQIAALLTWADQFIALDNLVAVFARWWGIKDEVPRAPSLPPESPINLETQIEQRNYLQMLWNEIQELPLRQRQTLLLTLRSGPSQSALLMFPVLQIASLRQLAAAMNMPAEELAAVWPYLPLQDAQVAERMNLTRRQVINLRKTARQRLLRKSRGW